MKPVKYNPGIGKKEISYCIHVVDNLILTSYIMVFEEIPVDIRAIFLVFLLYSKSL